MPGKIDRLPRYEGSVSHGSAGGPDDYALFDALGGELNWDEITQMLSAGRCPVALTRQVTFLMEADTTTAEQIVRDSFSSLQQRGLVAASEARVLLYREIVRRSHDAWIAAGSGALAPPARQREAFVVRTCAGLSERQAAWVMGISIGALRAHLARATSGGR